MKEKGLLKSGILKALKILLIFAFWIGIWWACAYFTGNSLLIPTPKEVLLRFFELSSTAEFYKTVLFSMLRVLFGTLFAVVSGILTAMVTARFSIIHDLVKPLITVIKSTPVSSFIILALIWFERSELPVFIVFLMVFPVVFTNVREGIISTDKKLIEMTRVYGLSPFARIKALYLPTVAPYFRSAVMSSAGLGWKAGIAAEVLAAPTVSIGKMLFFSKQYLETTDLFAWTLTVILMSLIIESLIALLSKVFLERKRYINGGENRVKNN